MMLKLTYSIVPGV